MQEIVNQVESNSSEVHEMVRAIITDATNELDCFIDSVKDLFLSDKNIPDGDLDKIILKIPEGLKNISNVI